MQVVSAHSPSIYALLEGPEGFLIQESLGHKIIATTLLALHSRMATLLETTTVETPPDFSGHDLIVADTSDANCIQASRLARQSKMLSLFCPTDISRCA